MARDCRDQRGGRVRDWLDARPGGVGAPSTGDIGRFRMRKSDFVKRIASEAFVTPLSAEMAIDILL